MGVYSFINVQATVAGPGLQAQIGSNSGAAKEGISCEMDEDKTTVTTGADGSIMHSLRASQTGRVTIRLLKTSPINQQLQNAYNFQRSSAANWGQNVIRVVDKFRGDVVSGAEMGFLRQPNNTWSEEGNILEWTFVGITRESLGAGPAQLTNP
jgi:hypothetical protein